MGASGTVYLIEKEGVNYILKVQALSKKSRKELERLDLLKGATYVVQLIESTNTWDKLYIVLSYGSQGSLDEFFNNSDYFKDIDNVFSFFRKLVEGLGTIHDRGLVHADIKMDNIVVNSDNEPMIIDFDNSASIGEVSGPRGTRSYMAPEMIRKFQNVEVVEFQPSLDFYAIGVMLYGIIKKNYPIDFEGYDYYAVMTYPIEFNKGDIQIFFDMAFGCLKPKSHRIGFEKLSNFLDTAAFESSFTVLNKDFEYMLEEFADESEKPEHPFNYMAIIYFALAILGVVFLGFLLKKCLVKKEKNQTEGNEDLGKNLDLESTTYADSQTTSTD